MSIPSTTPSVISTVESLIGGVASSAVPVVGLVDDGMKVVTEVVKEVELQFQAHNTPVMQSNVEAQKIEAERVKIEQETVKDDLTEDQKETGE